ncbi:unnamed protein product [Calypogeia fissa]
MARGGQERNGGWELGRMDGLGRTKVSLGSSGWARHERMELERTNESSKGANHKEQLRTLQDTAGILKAVEAMFHRRSRETALGIRFNWLNLKCKGGFFPSRLSWKQTVLYIAWQ